ncbi:MAG: DUF4149 domain-containing protein [Nitrospiraceae bacterium]
MGAPHATGRLLLVCYTVELVALSIWIGGLVVIIGTVVPAVFNSFGMEPGGRFLTRVFEGYNRLVALAIGILISAATWRFWVSARTDRRDAAVSQSEFTLLTVMIGVAALIMLVLWPESVTLQEQAFATQGEAARKAAYGAFFRTHTIVRGLYILNLGLGIALLAVKVRSLLVKRES